jgi:rSAM/selenodomain-associated transferase 1
MADRVAISILAKAPVPGLAKTRLIPALGADGAAALQERLIRRAVATAADAALGPVALWAAPDGAHPLFQALRRRYGVTLGRQPDGDLGARMQEAAAAANGPVLVVGTDCPALGADHLHRAAATLRNYDVVVIPAEDGGYVLIGLRQPCAALFADIAWSTPTVIDETRRRLRTLTLSWRELPTLWDVDRPEDLERARREGLLD